MTAAYSDLPLATQFTNGLPHVVDLDALHGRPYAAARRPGQHRKPWSGAGVRGGHRVNAGLLSALVGEDAVTTVELDEALAARAER
ncbi:hypothetical protein [Streptomyces sp. NPDC058434]|uniref:hypothetical protein n=1 Tax=Streptomyces sp. NPDC058434 TaxID=3346498 RepID=UPI0036590C3E